MTAHSIILEDTTALSNDIYIALCNILFKRWARLAKRAPVAAKKARNALSLLHWAYGEQQAMPAYMVDHYCRIGDIPNVLN